MAHTSFEVFPGTVSVLDSQTAMAVQSLLESQAAAAAEGTSGGPVLNVFNVSLDPDDLVQCGKCKKQFSSLIDFMNHKREHCVSLHAALTSSSISASNSVINADLKHSMNVTCSTIPSAISFNSGSDLDRPLSLHHSDPASYTTVVSSSLPQVVLNEADLLSLTALDNQTLTIPVHSTAASGSYLTPVASHTPLSGPKPLMVPIHSTSINHCDMSSTAIFTMAAVKTMPLLAKALSNSTVEIEEDALNTSLNGVSEHMQPPSSQGESVADVVLMVDGEEPSVQENAPVAAKLRKRRKAMGLRVDSSTKKVNKLQCMYCSKGFSKNFDLQQHIRAHTGEKPFQCIVCGRAFAQKSNVKKHMQTHKVWPNGISNVGLFGANLRDGSANTGTEGEAQETSVDQQPADAVDLKESPMTEEDAAWDRNEKEIKDPGDENSKEPAVVIDSSYICQFCNQSFKTYCHLKTHLKEHKNEQVYKCILKSCGQIFQELDTFLDHTKTHEPEMSYWCHICSKVFQSLYELGVHQYTHSMYPDIEGKQRESRFFHCSRCMNRYSTQSALELHMESTCHRFECRHCKKVFPSERYLRRHLPTHSSQRPHKCTVCLKGFKTEHYLRMHMLIHSGDKPFQCQQCQASFNRKDKLKRHMLTHESVKRFKCPFRAHTGCNKEFHRPDKLKAHVISHSGVRPYKCRQCSRAFSRRAHLREHQQLHSETADCKFLCATCGNSFIDDTKLKEHACDLAPAAPNKRRRMPRTTKGRSLPRMTMGRTATTRKSKAQNARSAAHPKEEKKLVLKVKKASADAAGKNEDSEDCELSLCEVRLNIALDDPLDSYDPQDVPGSSEEVASHPDAAGEGDNHRTYSDFGALQNDLLLDGQPGCADLVPEPESIMPCTMVVSGDGGVMLAITNVMNSEAANGDIASHLSEI